MPRTKSSPTRRLLAATAGAALATVGALTFASPASAHAGAVDGSFECVAGEWVVNWVVKNDMSTKEATVTAVTANPGDRSVSNITVGAIVPKRQGQEWGQLTGEQRLPADAKGAAISVTLDWPRNSQSPTYTKNLEFDRDCEAPPATPTPPPTTPPATTPPTAPPTTPPTTTPPPTTPPATPAPPTGGDESTCDKLILTVSNPEDGAEFTIVFTPNEGEPKSVTVQPGDDAAVEFPGTEGLTVTPSVGDVKGEPIAWTKPEDCGGGGGGDLPLTGAAAGGIAGGAVLLLAAGVVLYIVARRRRVTFTA